MSGLQQSRNVRLAGGSAGRYPWASALRRRQFDHCAPSAALLLRLESLEERSDFAEAIRDRQLRLRCPCRDASSLDAFFLLRQRHRLSDQAEPDFQIRNLAEMQDAAKQSTETIATLLEAVAAISLIVGGIGIANVMLVSVTERTREIGIRIAVGGRGRDILFQFLTEAVVLATVGGVIGLTLGIGVSKWMAARGNWPTLLSPPVMLGTMLAAGLAGVVAGFYPALRASRLDPIEALRFE